ncbi:MAG: hypothetical protein SF029_08105 [bacterium]|nr:hypothetical protein [bacterium]
MVTLHLKGRITESGRLEVDLPQGTPPGEVTVKITLEAPAEKKPKREFEPRRHEEHED